MDNTERGLAPSRRDDGDFSMLMIRCRRACVKIVSPRLETVREGSGRPARPLAPAFSGSVPASVEEDSDLPESTSPTPTPGGGGGGGAGLPPRTGLFSGRLRGFATTVDGAMELNPVIMRLEL